MVFSRTTWPISTKLCTKHPWVKGISSCSNDGPHPLPRGDNYEIAKIHWRNLKIFFSRTTGLISTKFGTKHLWMKGIQVCSNEESNSKKADNVSFLQSTLWYNHLFIDLNCFLVWTMWPMGLLLTFRLQHIKFLFQPDFLLTFLVFKPCILFSSSFSLPLIEGHLFLI